MPTLLTALHAHAKRVKPRVRMTPAVVAGGLLAEGKNVYTAEMVSLLAESPRTIRKLNVPTRKMSLRDRFLIRRKAVGRRKIVSKAFEFISCGQAREPASDYYDFSPPNRLSPYQEPISQ